MNFFRLIIDWYKCRRDPVEYARNLGVKIGSRCRLVNIKPLSGTFGSEPYLIAIGDDVTVAGNVQFITHDGGVAVFRDDAPDIDVFGRIVIGNNVFIGYGAIIMPNICVGNNVVIGASSVVTRDVPDNSVVAGNPARMICSIDEYKISVFKKCIRVKNMSKIEKKNFLREIFKD